MINQRLFFILAALFAFASLQAQTHPHENRRAKPAFRIADHNDKPIEIHRTDGLDTTYSDTIQHIFLTYTPTGQVERKLFGYLDTITMILDWKERWDNFYDSIDQKTETIYNTYDNATWTPVSRDTYTYDSLSYLVAHDNYEWTGTVWDLLSQQAWGVSLDGLGRLDSLLEQYADAPNFNWNDVELNEYHYNASSEWDTVTTTPLPSGIKHRAIYGAWHDFANDKPLSWHVEVFFGIWLNQIQFNRSYGTFGSYDVFTDVWQGSVWAPTFKSSFVNDAEEHSILEESYQLDTASAWQLTTQNIFVNTYDVANRLARRSAHMIEFQFSDTTDYVDHFTYTPFVAVSTPASDAVTVWPNPSNGTFNLTLPAKTGNWSLRIVDAQGRLRMAGTLQGTLANGIELPASWSSGTYFYILQSEKGQTHSGKLLLQR